MRRNALATMGVVLVCVLALELACRAALIDEHVLPAPGRMVAASWEIVRSGEYNAAIAMTLTDIVVSAVIAIGGGFAAGALIRTNPFVRRAVEPYLASYYAVPTFIFYPVFVVLFGVGRGAIIAITVLLAIVAMVTATMSGLDQIPRVLDRTGRVLHMPPLARAMLIQLPAAAPHLFTGARLAIAYSFIGVIASEFILSGDGLGYAIAYAYNNFENETMYGLILLVVIVVVVINVMLDHVDHRLQARRRR